MTAAKEVTNQVYLFTGKKTRDEDIKKFTSFLDNNKIEYRTAYNSYSISDGVQINVIGSINDLACLEYCLNNGMIL